MKELNEALYLLEPLWNSLRGAAAAELTFMR